MSTAVASRRFRTLWIAAGAFTVAAGLGSVGVSALYRASLIKPLLPAPGAFACFSATFDTATVDVEDWTKGRQVKSGTVKPDGSPQMVTVFDRETDVSVSAMTLRLDYDSRKSDYDWIYNFTLRAETGKGRLTARGECPWYDKDYVETRFGTLPAGTFTLACGIDCDGGLVDVTRVTGTRDVAVEFGRRIGLTMKSGCGVEGGRLRVYANARGQSLRLAPAPPEACTDPKSRD
jgi:hypothetical protein